MTEFFLNYGLFLAKAVTVLIVAAVLIVLAFSASKVSGGGKKGRIRFRNLNEDRWEMQEGFAEYIDDDEALKALKKQEKEQGGHKASDDKKRVFVIDFDGGEDAKGDGNLAGEVEAILSVARPSQDEVVIRLNSPGGHVHAYGLAAEHLKRLRDAGITMTACVDEIAASGGYMMACVAHKIVAAPFSMIGSIGVVAGVPNINRLLTKHGVDYEDFTAGDYKRTVTMMGPITDEGREKFKEQLAEVHVAFKDHVQSFRPDLDVSAIATGEYWLGSQAIHKGLVDEIGTSARVIQDYIDEAPVYLVSFKRPKEFSSKLSRFLVRTARLTVRGLQAEMASKPKF